MSCVWVNTWKDSGDRGAAQCDHDRAFHPTHEHTFAMPDPDGDYGWSTEPRCVHCGLLERQDRQGQCSPHATTY